MTGNADTRKPKETKNPEGLISVLAEACEPVQNDLSAHANEEH